MTRENLLTLNSQVEDEIGCLSLNGDLIAETRFEPERVLREWLEAGVCRAIIHCPGLGGIDSAGFSILLAALHRYRREGGDLILAEMNPVLNSIFEVTAMEKYFKIFPSIAAARSHFDQMAVQHKKRPGRAAGQKIHKK